MKDVRRFVVRLCRVPVIYVAPTIVSVARGPTHDLGEPAPGEFEESRCCFGWNKTSAAVYAFVAR